MSSTEIDANIRYVLQNNDIAPFGNHSHRTTFCRLRLPKLNKKKQTLKSPFSSPRFAGRVKGNAASSMPQHSVFGFFIPSLISLLQAKCEAKDENPFETHPLHAYAFLVQFCIYCVALAIKMEIQSMSKRFRDQLLGRIILVFGTLSSVSIVSILLPRLEGYIFLVTGTFLPIIVAIFGFRRCIQCLCVAFEKAVIFVVRFMERITKNDYELPN